MMDPAGIIPSEGIQNLFRNVRWYVDELRKPKELPKGLYQWTSEADFIKIIDKGAPVLVAMGIKGSPMCEQFRLEFEKAFKKYGIDDTWEPDNESTRLPGADSARFVWVDCGKDESAERFCRSRKPVTVPYLELFHAEKKEGTDIVNVRVFQSDMHFLSYGIREFIRLHGFLKGYRETEVGDKE